MKKRRYITPEDVEEGMILTSDEKDSSIWKVTHRDNVTPLEWDVAYYHVHCKDLILISLNTTNYANLGEVYVLAELLDIDYYIHEDYLKAKQVNEEVEGWLK